MGIKKGTKRLASSNLQDFLAWLLPVTFLMHVSGATLTTLKKKMFAIKTIWVSKKGRKVWGAQISKNFFSYCFWSPFWCVWLGINTDTLKKKMFADRTIWVPKWGRKDWWAQMCKNFCARIFPFSVSGLNFSVCMNWE